MDLAFMITWGMNWSFVSSEAKERKKRGVHAGNTY